MAWYTTGTIAVSGTTVTGTGTNWLDNKQSIGAGQALLIPGSGTVKMYEIASVTSATKLTLKTSPGTIAAGQAYAILSFYTDSVPDFARRLAAQLSYYQSQMDGWQQIMTGTGSINMTAPDGTTVTISSFSKLTADVAAAMTDKGNLTSTVDLNTLGAAASWGVYTQTANANALIALNYPEQKAGTLLCTKAAYNGVIQTYIPFDSGQIYTRALSGNWNGTDGPWREWQTVGYSSQTGQFTGDCNTLTSSGRWSISSSATNQAVASTPGTLLVQRRTSATDLYQEFIAIGSAAGSTNRTYQRTLSGTTWSPWVEFVNGTDARLNTVDGKTGGTITSTVTVNAPVLVNAPGNYGIAANTLVVDATGYTGRFALVSGTSSTYDVQMHYRLVNNAYHCLRFIQGGIETFRAQSNGACYAVSFNSTSDSNLKFNKKFIESSLLKSMSLRGMTYDLNNERKVGIIAQDAREVLPESVTENLESVVLEDGTILEKTLSLDYSAIAGLHTEAIKEVVSLMLECLTNPESAKSKLTELVAAINTSTDDANETEMRMEWALVNQPETPPEQPVTDSANADS